MHKKQARLLDAYRLEVYLWEAEAERVSRPHGKINAAITVSQP